MRAAPAPEGDIGGLGQSADGRQVFHEGLFIPLLPLVREGVFNESLLRVIRANVREPVQVEGDLHALVACNLVGERRLSGMLAEHGLRDLNELGAHIIGRSRAGMARAISALPQGTWHGAMRIDGYDQHDEFERMAPFYEQRWKQPAESPPQDLYVRGLQRP